MAATHDQSVTTAPLRRRLAFTVPVAVGQESGVPMVASAETRGRARLRRLRFPLAGGVASAVVHAVGLLVLSLWLIGVGEALRVYASLEVAVVEDVEPQPAALLAQLDSSTESPATARDFDVPIMREERIEPPAIHMVSGLLDRAGGPAAAKPPPLASRTAAYARGANFFGLTAAGNRFAFVLDASGSMREGTRYRRATAELMKAIDGLTEEQEFFVVLFQSQTVPMLWQKAHEIQMLPAESETKARLDAWLGAAQPLGWSDPRTALHAALALEPDAIFLLSDGEFKSVGDKRIGGDTLRKVRHWNEAYVPIHTIAFEDPINRKVLRALAEQTGGSFRFVPAEKR